MSTIFSRQSGAVVIQVAEEGGFYAKGPGFKCPISHGCQTVSTWARSKTGRREVPGSFFSHACRSSHSEFSLDFSKTRGNTGQDPFERSPRRALHLLAKVPRETIGLKVNNQPTNRCIKASGTKVLIIKQFLFTKLWFPFYWGPTSGQLDSYLHPSIHPFYWTPVNAGRISQKDPHGGQSTYRPRSLVRQSALTPTTNQIIFLIVSDFTTAT